MVKGGRRDATFEGGERVKVGWIVMFEDSVLCFLRMTTYMFFIHLTLHRICSSEAHDCTWRNRP